MGFVSENVRGVVREGVAEIILKGRGDLHILSWQALRDMERALDWAVEGPKARVAILSGEGGKTLTAGADIRQMAVMGPDEAREFSTLGQRVAAKIEALPIPVIVVINGFCLGGGLEMALACDIRIASDRSFFSQPEIDIGIIPGWGASQRLPRVVGIGKAREMIYTGRKIDAKEAYRIGLVNMVLPEDDLAAETRKLAMEISSKGAVALVAAKRSVSAILDLPQEEGLEYERDVWAYLFGTKDQKESMTAFLEKRKPNLKDTIDDYPLPPLPTEREKPMPGGPRADPLSDFSAFYGRMAMEAAMRWMEYGLRMQEANRRMVEQGVEAATRMFSA